MASNQLQLQSPPSKKRSFEHWLQHAAGRIIFEDMRGYALERIDPNLSSEAQAAAQKAINDAVYGLMMVIDGVSGTLRNEQQAVELSVVVSLLNRNSEEVVAEIDLREGDGMCMGYHGWLDGDYGEDPVAVVVERSLSSLSAEGRE
ncbi:hypothetical protein CHU94_18790 [Rhodoferax sp. TH121]|uniref:hypothetical protein n=1 Tax=Rhodoferax sp. TH121 TaxID=2022803 RepID=UPI000B96CE84|nr:hypothetical protein [Rhodoferax sp. TH121]OYQ39413.1 hypothetical protein CHU94_18790 [Rhodoferax sp. TH121]